MNALISVSNRGLPLEKQRSGVFSSRRESTETPLEAAWPDLVAAVSVVLFRYHGASPVPLGVGTSSPQLIQVPIEASARVREVRKRARALLGALGGSTPQIDGSRNPDFDVSVLAAPPDADYREDLTIYPAATTLQCLWRARLLDQPCIERFLGHLRAVLGAADADAVQDVCLLGPGEEALIRRFESGGAAVGATAPVHAQVIDQTRRTPASTALEFGSHSITYSELERRSAVVARALIAGGTRPGDAVGLCVSAASGVVALLGVMRAGAAVVPIDATLPQERLKSHVMQAAIRCAVIENSTRGIVPLSELISLDELAWDARVDSPAVDIAVPTESPAYILFTSGSTGAPKGIRMSHRGLSNVVAWQSIHSGQVSRTLHRTSLAFDVGMQEVFATLCHGGCLIVADEEVRADPSLLPHIIARYAIERVFLPPVSLYHMAAALDTHPQSLPSLKEIYVAGEALKLDPPVIRMFRDLSAVLENQYGPTETHVATTFRLDAAPLRWPALPPIGRPVPGLEVGIVDARGRRVPIGTVGEIVVRGCQVADGYVGGARFIGSDGKACYATGDLGRWTSAGGIEFHGRKDRQIKVRGYRIEPAEIELALQAQPGVRAAIVATLEDRDTPRLVAWVVAGPGFPGVAVVRKRLLEVLPGYMVPAIGAFALLDQAPLTHTGKIDFQALQPPWADDSKAAPNYVPSRNEVEAIVAEIWRQELGLPRVGVYDDFVEIGGHSLIAIHIVSQLNDRFGVSLPLRLLLSGGTIAGVTERLMNGASDYPPVKDLVRCPLPDGRVVLAPSAGEAQYLWHDIFTCNSYGARIAYTPDAVIVDVGAHIGLYTLYALSAAPTGRIIAIEPVPLLFDALKQNTAEQRQRVAYYAVAAGAVESSEPLTYYPTLSGMSSLRANAAADASLLRTIMRNLLRDRPETGRLANELDDIVSERLIGHTLQCPVRRLESILDEAAPERIDVLKIDVQRYEEPVLHGVGTAWQRVRQVVIELHDEDGALERVDGYLRLQGFSTTAMQQPIHAGTPVRFITGVR